MSNQIRQVEQREKVLFSVAVLLFYLFYLFSQINIYLFQSLWRSYYLFTVPILFGFTVAIFRKTRTGEFWIFLAYWAWFIISRILNKDYALVSDFNQVVDLALMVPFFALGLLLNAKERKRFLNWLSGIVGGYYFVLGIICIISYVFNRDFPNPISQQFIASTVPDSDFVRISIMDTNVDTTAFWFMSGLLLMVYQVLSSRKWIWKVLAFLAACVDYSVVGMTFTRSVFLATGVILGLLAALVIFEKNKGKKPIHLLLILMIPVFLVTAFIGYRGFYAATDSLGRLAVAIEEKKNATAETLTASPDGDHTTAQNSESQEQAESSNAPRVFSDNRNTMDGGITKFSSGRISIYKSAIEVLREDSSLFLRGCLYDESANKLTKAMEDSGGSKQGKFVPHYQNYLIQVLVVTGLPGLALVMVFCLMLVVKVIRYYFLVDPQIDIGMKSLVFPVTASLIYGLFESCFFTVTDVRSCFFFLLSGLFLGFWQDTQRQAT